MSTDDVSALITAHMVVKNDDRFIWYAIQAVLPYVDRFLITDTGSTDYTLPIIRSIRSDKIELKTMAISRPQEVVSIRNEQLQQTRTPWIWLVDADEMYSKTGALEVVQTIAKAPDNVWGIVVPFYNFAGDLYHVQTEAKGHYRFGNRIGHLNLRLLRCLSGLKVIGTYPTETYVHDGVPLQSFSSHLQFVNTKFFHAGNIQRSSLGHSAFSRKVVIDKGVKRLVPLPENLRYPSAHLPAIHNRRTIWYEIVATLKQKIKPDSPSNQPRYSPSLTQSAGYYDEAAAASMKPHTALERLYSLIRGGSLLEIGAGEGSKLSRFKVDVAVGVDLSLEGLRRFGKTNNLPVQANANRLPFKAGTFDYVTSLFSIEHVSDPANVIKEMIRVLKPGGTLAIVAPNFGAPNRASPCFRGSRLVKLGKGLAADLGLISSTGLPWNQVKPRTPPETYQSDFDTTVEPYVKTLLSFLQKNDCSIKEWSSSWEMPMKAESLPQKIWHCLGQTGVYPFSYWGPHLLVIAVKQV